MAAADETPTAYLLQDTFDIKGQKFTVTLTAELLKWHPVNGTSKDEVVTPINEILSVRQPTEELKTSNELSPIHIAYIKHKKGYYLGREEVTLGGKSDVCTKWCHTIQEGLNQVPKRPKKALVLINPISGNKKGPQLYDQKVAPVFKETSVQAHVITTESADHVKEIIDSHDLTSIDSVIVVGGDGMYHLVADALLRRLAIVGGDGMYHLVADALLRRLAREADVDLDNAEIDIRQTPWPIGIIPCGTGNGIAMACYGCVDVETAALAIIRGHRERFNVYGVWSEGEFITFSILCQGFGVLADLMYDTDAWRNWGIWRYLIVLGKYMLVKGSARVLDVSVETRPPAILPAQTDAQTDDATRDKHQQNADSQPPGVYSQPWQSHNGRHVLLGAFLADYSGVRETRNPEHLNFSRLFMMKDWGRIHFLRFFPCMVTYNPACLHFDNIDHKPFVEYKVKLNNPEEQEGHANHLNIDGEIFYLKQPNFHVKLFPGKMNLFASTSMKCLLLP